MDTLKFSAFVEDKKKKIYERFTSVEFSFLLWTGEAVMTMNW